MGGGLLLLTLIAVYIVVYWLMAAEKDMLAKYSGILAFMSAKTASEKENSKEQKKVYLKAKRKKGEKWSPRRK